MNTLVAQHSVSESGSPAASNVTPHKRGNATESGDSDNSHDEKKQKKPGRKPITTEASSKRTAQNRAAQRAFRERKQQYLKGLEEKVKELTEQQERTSRENEELKKCVNELKKENVSLKSNQFTYDEPPATIDFDKAISELFDSSNSSDLGLTSVLGMQNAALQGTDFTKPGAMNSIRSTLSNESSPQNVPSTYSGTGLDSQTSSGAISVLPKDASAQSAFSAIHSPTGQISNEMLNGIQLLSTNKNVTTGSFLDHFLNSSESNTPSTVPISPDSTLFDRRSSLKALAGSSDRLSPLSPGGSASNTSTPHDMFVPLNNIPVNSHTVGSSITGTIDRSSGISSMSGGVQLPNSSPFLPKQLSAGNLPGLSPTGTSTEANSASMAQNIDHTLFDKLLQSIPSTTKLFGDGLISVVPTSTLSASTAAPTVTPTASDGLQQSKTHDFIYPPPVATENYSQNQAQLSGLPPQLTAYRNVDPLNMGDDGGDQLEKLLLGQLYNFNSLSSSTATNTQTPSTTAPNADLDTLPWLTAPPSALTTTGQNNDNFMLGEGSAAVAAAAAASLNTINSLNETPRENSTVGTPEQVCTCTNCDNVPCDPCPKHGNPADLSEELKEVAPQVLNYVCTKTNRLADDELNDLCSLMYKHAKCTEVQRRVELERERLKAESELNHYGTKTNTSENYNPH